MCVTSCGLFERLGHACNGTFGQLTKFIVPQRSPAEMPRLRFTVSQQATALSMVLLRVALGLKLETLSDDLQPALVQVLRRPMEWAKAQLEGICRWK